MCVKYSKMHFSFLTFHFYLHLSKLSTYGVTFRPPFYNSLTCVHLEVMASSTYVITCFRLHMIIVEEFKLNSSLCVPRFHMFYINCYHKLCYMHLHSWVSSLVFERLSINFHIIVVSTLLMTVIIVI